MVLLLAEVIVLISRGAEFVLIVSSLWAALAITSLIYVEWRCYQYLKYSVVVLPR